ncbi:uncharacterized protein RMCC_0981 [Mycolicibacterium canariasense]|uniref:Uncharacterized protein n=1 Tax=Mycolicibacterium canariasense TaxID=228230 RepID=A0A100W9H6_MYCCR|nr:hypothetical protein [Mycolicibacterium canariasense]GAS94015.1 uncharacterized protein RMCC_0981 [Mycolicibacterium canariasense]
MSVSAETAAKFGQVTLPPGVEVLGVDTDSGRDTRYRLALRMTGAQLIEFLAQFPWAPRKSDIPKSMQVVAGPPLNSAPAPLYGQDQITTTDHGTVTREVIVDERSPDEVYVHLSLFTT